MQQNNLTIYPLFVALTRPPMMMGVTQTYFVCNFVPSMIIFLISMNIIISGSVFILLHALGMICCSKDDRLFEMLLGYFELACPNKKIWGCNSYDPN